MIVDSQKEDGKLQEIVQLVSTGDITDYAIDESGGLLLYNSRLCVPNDMDLRKKILYESNNTVFTMHPGGSKMYQDMKQYYGLRWMKKILCFGRKGKLSPRFIGPYEILERVGLVTYRLELPLELAKLHDVFHVSMLRRYRSDESHILPVHDVQVQEDFSYDEEPKASLDHEIRQLRNKQVPL